MEQLDALDVQPDKKEDKVVLNESNIIGYIKEEDKKLVISNGEKHITRVEEELKSELNEIEQQFRAGMENPNSDFANQLASQIRDLNGEMKKLIFKAGGQETITNPSKYAQLKQEKEGLMVNLKTEMDILRQDLQRNYDTKVAEAKESAANRIEGIKKEMDRQIKEGTIAESQIQTLMSNFQKSVDELNKQVADLAKVSWRDDGEVNLKKDSEEFDAISQVAESIESDVQNAINSFVYREKKANEIMLTEIPNGDLKDLLAGHTDASLKSKNTDTMAASFEEKDPSDNVLLNFVREQMDAGQKVDSKKRGI